MGDDDDRSGLGEVVETLRSVEERLRDAAYEALRAAADGDEQAEARERRILQARRAIERALRALGGATEE
jgi:hypothetical protein